MTKMTKYQLEHFENKVRRYFQPLIDEQELLVKQYKTEATNNVIKKLAKKMGADKILQQMRDAEEFLKEARDNARTFFEKKQSKKRRIGTLIVLTATKGYHYLIAKSSCESGPKS